jgi:transposase
VREYPKEYKLESVRLFIENGKHRNKTAKELGIPLTTLRGWIKKYMSEVIGKVKDKKDKKDYEKELHDKEKIIERLKEEIQILKKSIGIFTRDPQQK